MSKSQRNTISITKNQNIGQNSKTKTINNAKKKARIYC
jgi:hypothetical protein